MTSPVHSRATAIDRRRLLGLAALGAAAAAAAVAAPSLARAATGAQPLVEVWKDPNCGCCGDWVKHLEAEGFRVKVHDTGNTAIRTRLGVAQKYGSCHTGLVGGYAIEGHVPAREIRRLLREKPDAIGLAVPGMPVGSPGMEVEGTRRDAFDVVLFDDAGGRKVWQRYAARS